MKIYDLFDMEFQDLLKLLGEHGITNLTVGDCSITLNGKGTIQHDLPESNWATDDKKLPCGHNEFEANILGECLHGCINKPEDKE
jgi:hypothetical protein